MPHGDGSLCKKLFDAWNKPPPAALMIVTTDRMHAGAPGHSSGEPQNVLRASLCRYPAAWTQPLLPSRPLRDSSNVLRIKCFPEAGSRLNWNAWVQGYGEDALMLDR